MGSTEVPLFIPTACSTAHQPRTAGSNAGTAGPCVRYSQSSTETTACTSASLMSWWPYGMYSNLERPDLAAVGFDPAAQRLRIHPLGIALGAVAEAIGDFAAALDAVAVEAPAVDRRQDLEVVVVLV